MTLKNGKKLGPIKKSSIWQSNQGVYESFQKKKNEKSGGSLDVVIESATRHQWVRVVSMCINKFRFLHVKEKSKRYIEYNKQR